jgi:hypothetical protein
MFYKLCTNLKVIFERTDLQGKVINQLPDINIYNSGPQGSKVFTLESGGKVPIHEIIWCEI